MAAGLVAAMFLLGGAEHWFGSDPCPHHEGVVVATGIAEATGAEQHAQHARHADDSDGSESHTEEHGPC
jgi:hypothetical protein